MCDVIIHDVLRNVAEHTDATMRQRHRIGSAVRYIKLKRSVNHAARSRLTLAPDDD